MATIARRSPLFSYVLAIVVGLIPAYFLIALVTSDVPPMLFPAGLSMSEYLYAGVRNLSVPLILYGVLAVPFGFAWAGNSWRWGLWLGIPVLVFFVGMGGPSAVFYSPLEGGLHFATITAVALLVACAAAYAGSRFPREIGAKREEER